MTSMIRKPTAFAAALLAISLFGTSARADLTVTVSEDGATSGVNYFTTTVAGTPGVVTAGAFNVATTDYSISVTSGTESQTSFTQLLGSDTLVTNTTGNSGHTLTVSVTGTLFSAPVTPPNITLNSQIGGTATQTASTDSLTYQSYVNGVGQGLQTVTPFAGATASANIAFANQLTPPGTITSLSAPFTLSQLLTVQLNAKDDSFNNGSSTSLTSVPEPSSMAIAGLGALGLIGYGLRRRKALGA